MSTISDALKKAQRNRSSMMGGAGSKPTLDAQPRNEGYAPPPAVPPPRGNGTNLVVAGLGIAVICFILAVQFRTSSPKSTPRKGELERTPSPGPAPMAGMGEKPPLPQPSPSQGQGGVASSPQSEALKEGEGKPAGVVAQASKTVEPQAHPLPMPPPREDLPTLYGTFYSEVNPVAIINGSAVKEGEVVGGYTVVKILPRSVIVKSSGGEVELKLK